MGYDKTNPEHIAARLSAGQISTVTGLDGEPCVLGCAEPVAMRLAVATKQRPALTVQTKGERYWEFALNEMGWRVKAVLLRQGFGS
ncbi:hypothetical protein [uncultured Sphingomonas sp.]|uniref:hypothetical protein n=1 Tax=uncultured Sphingomonas sp. TaxID=158754 RepID=UPI0025E68ABA|nr:hypothetical protein [uncultured Sphingomonas sp.]